MCEYPLPYLSLTQRSYDQRRGTWLEGPRADSAAFFVAGLAAGLAAKLVSHPLDVVKKRYQVAGLQRSLRWAQGVKVEGLYPEGRLKTLEADIIVSDPVHCSYGARVETGFALNSLGQGLLGIYRNEGMAGLWKGSGPSIIKVWMGE